MKKIIQYFRATINFIEKFVKVFFGLIKSNYQLMKKFHSFLIGLHVTPTESHKYGYAVLVCIIGILFLIPMAIWAGLKSI